MPRTLPTAVNTNITRRDGMQAYRVITITPPTGSAVSYSDRDITAPVTAAGKVLSWGSSSISLRDGAVSGYSNLSVTIADPTNALGTLFAAHRGGVNRFAAEVILYFPEYDESVTEFVGKIGSANLAIDDGAWEIEIEDHAKQADIDIGIRVTKDTFTGLTCVKNDDIVPVAYGAPVYRVPLPLIDGPGESLLASKITICSDTFTIASTATDAGFSAGTIQIAVGMPGDYEIFTGSFTGATFTITARSRVVVEGESAGVYAEAGDTYLTVPAVDVDPTNYRGFLVVVPDIDCSGRVITEWFATGSNYAILKQPDGVTFPSGGGWTYKIIGGPMPVWPVGVGVWELGDYVYALNATPTSGLTRVEGLVASQARNSAFDEQTFAEIDSGNYTYTANNTAYNSAIGRDPGDPGIATVTIDTSPVQLGFIDGKVYGTFSTSITNPIAAIADLAFNAQLGGLSTSLKDTTAFTAAEAAITKSVAFARTQVFKLDAIIADIAQQSTAAIIWDQGKMLPVVLSAEPGGSGTIFNQDNIEGRSLTIREMELKEIANRVEGSFRFTIPGNERRVIRQSDTAIADFGENMKALDVWAYQTANDVAEAAGFWVAYRLNEQREYRFTTFLEGVALRPGDDIRVAWTAGASTTLLATSNARVQSIQRGESNAGKHAFTITARGPVTTYAVVAVSPSGNCDEIESPVLPPPPESDLIAGSYGLNWDRATEFQRPTDSPATAGSIGSGGSLSTGDVIHLSIFGRPTSGDVDLDVNADSTTETVTLNYNTTAAAAQTAFEGHSSIGSGFVIVKGGPWPHVSLEVLIDESIAVVYPLSISGNTLAADVDDPCTPEPKMRRATIL